MTPLELLGAYGPAAGIATEVTPFVGAPEGASTGGLRARLAHNPFLMAPMAGVSDGAYRLMARTGGAALAYTEMVSVAGIHYGGEKTWDLVCPVEGEPDIAVQLFGSRPEQFREAAAAVQERLGRRLVLLDINMACPVPKVTRKGEGSALLDDPTRAADIVRACMAEATVPVTCKIRRGRRTGEEVAPEFARAMEAAGAAALTVHGRTASQLYRGQADWGVVSRVAQAVKVPVIGSGDVLDAGRAVRMLRETGAAAVMVARGSYGAPWLFGEARDILAGREPHVPTLEERLSALELQLRLLDATGAHMARGRSIAGWYLRGLPHAASWRGRFMGCASIEEFVGLCHELREAAREVG